MTPLIHTSQPETLTDFSQLLINAQQETWDSQWFLRDACKAARDHAPESVREGWLQGLQEETGISHQKIIKWAEEADLVPPDERAQDKAPVGQIAEARALRKAVWRDEFRRENEREP